MALSCGLSQAGGGKATALCPSRVMRGSTVEVPPNSVSDASFESEVLEADGLVLVDFWAPWCSPCRTMMSLIKEVAEEYAVNVRVVAVNVQAAPVIAARFGALTVPLLVFLEAGAMTARGAGVMSRTPLCGFLETNLGGRR